MSQKMGIYRIANKVSGKAYIGSSADIPQRIKKHLSVLRNGHHLNGHLQNAFKLYGEAAFDFGVAEYVSDTSDLIAREQYWIDSIGTDNLYNICLIAEKPPSWKGKTHSPETRAKVSLRRKGKTQSPEQRIINSLSHKGQVGNGRKPVKQIDPNTGKVVATFASSYEAAAGVGIKSRTNIIGACRSDRRKAGGYWWRFAEDEDTIFIKPWSSTIRKAVEQIDPSTGEVIKTFPSITLAASEVGIKKISLIIRVCQGKRKTSGGYGWRYA